MKPTTVMALARGDAAIDVDASSVVAASCVGGEERDHLRHIVDFDQPAHFIDLEGGDPVLADPSLIARNYHTAVHNYFTEFDELVRSTGMDYHRVKLHERYDDVLVRFLLNRTPKSASR